MSGMYHRTRVKMMEAMVLYIEDTTPVKRACIVGLAKTHDSMRENFKEVAEADIKLLNPIVLHCYKAKQEQVTVGCVCVQ